MAFIVPAIVALGATAAAGGVAGFAAFATIAGTVMTGAGLITGNKKLTKLGGYIGLAGGLGNMAMNLVGGASSAASAAGAAGSDAGLIGRATADAAGNAATSTLQDAALAGARAGAESGVAGIGGAAQAGGAATLQELPNALNQTGGSLAPAAEGGALSITGSEGAMTASSPLTQDALNLRAEPYQFGAEPFNIGQGGAGQNALQAAGQEIPSIDHLQSLLDKVRQGANGISNFVRENKEVVNMLGKGVEAMNDPRREAMEFQVNLMDQRRRNLNNPVRMGVTPGSALQLNTAPGG